MKYITTLADEEFIIEILDDGRISVNGDVQQIDFQAVGDQPLYSLLIEGSSFEGYIYPGNDTWKVLLQGTLYDIRVEDEREKRLRAAAGGGTAIHDEFHLKSPMPGLVIAVPVEEGQAVEKGDVLVILESMKMQNELRSPRTGKVLRIRVKTNDSVEQRQTLLSVI